MADTRGQGSERGEWLRRSVVLSAFITLIGAVAGSVFWFQGVPEEALARPGTPETTPLRAGSPQGGLTLPTARAVAPSPTGTEPVHADVYFDFKSTRLRADAALLLQEKAALLTSGEPWAVLVQGHADQRGDAAYNRLLAQRRADAVKQFLIELGVPESSIKAAAFGQDSALCDDPGTACQQLNRRVHLEFRRLPRTSGLSVQPVRAQIARADALDTRELDADEVDADDTDAQCDGHEDDDEADWSDVSSFAK